MTTYLANSFSLQMLDTTIGHTIKVVPISATDVPDDAVSVIGHPDTANVVADILGRDVACNRTSIALSAGDVLYVAQLTGGRLPEGSTKLPDGFNLVFLKVTID